MKKSDLKIGTTLYQYSSQILEYELIEIQKLKTKDHTETFYILECLVCNGHDNCLVATKYTKNGLEFSHMINNEDESYWHKNKDYNWFLDKSSARIFVCDYYIKWNENSIKEKEGIIERYKKSIKEHEEKKLAILDERNK